MRLANGRIHQAWKSASNPPIIWKTPSSLIPPPSLLDDASYLGIHRLGLASRNLPRQPGSDFWTDRNRFRKLEVVATFDSTCVFYLLHTSYHRAVAACCSGDAQRRQGLLTTYYLLTGREPLLFFGRVGGTY